MGEAKGPEPATEPQTRDVTDEELKSIVGGTGGSDQEKHDEWHELPRRRLTAAMRPGLVGSSLLGRSASRDFPYRGLAGALTSGGLETAHSAGSPGALRRRRGELAFATLPIPGSPVR